MGDEYEPEEVCGMPFLRADSGQVIAYYQQTMQALGRVRDSSLTKIVDVCRTALDSSRNRRLERIDPSYIIKNKPAPARR